MNSTSELPGSQTLRPGNKALYGALITAISMTYHLDDAGCTAIDVDIRGGRAVLQIDRPPAFVRGATSVSRRVGDRIERRVVAPYHGGQIEWTEREPRVRTAEDRLHA